MVNQFFIIFDHNTIGFTEKKCGLDKDVAEAIEEELRSGLKPQLAVSSFYFYF